ncbi:hypothetical protein RUM43_009347 [Polyplax serrata]|uniref:Uncharacterized protein n=1 Tax=Polyplax serrata TaxID=468196 RepID=A0AAN8S4H0_POLSC
MKRDRVSPIPLQQMHTVKRVVVVKVISMQDQKNVHKAPRVRSVPVTEATKEGQWCSEVLGGGRHLSDKDLRKVDGKAVAVVVTGYANGRGGTGEQQEKLPLKEGNCGTEMEVNFLEAKKEPEVAMNKI